MKKEETVMLEFFVDEFSFRYRRYLRPFK